MSSESECQCAGLPVQEPTQKTKDVLKAYHMAVSNPELESVLNSDEAAAVAEVRAARTQDEWLAAVVKMNKALETRVPQEEMLQEQSPTAEESTRQVSR